MTSARHSALLAALVIFSSVLSGGTAIAQCTIQPGAIPNIRTTAFSTTSWTIAWDPPANADGTVYEVIANSGTGYCNFGPDSLAGTTTTTSFTQKLTGLNTTYGLYVRVQGDPCKVTQYRLVVDTFTTVPSKPAPPTATVSGNSVTLSFSYSDDRTFGVDVWRTGADNQLTFLGYVQTCKANPKTFTDPNVPTGVYTYRLGVFNNANIQTEDVYSDPVTVTVGNVVKPVITAFAATPPTIRAGQSAVLTFATQSATSVTLDQGLGAQPLSGSVTVSPAATTTYTLTAMNGGQSVTSTVTVTVITAPSVAVSAFPTAMLQVAGLSGGSTSYTLTNAGGGSTNITLSQSGNFFTQSPTSFTLPPGASQIVTVSGLAEPAGAYEGAATVSGSGVPSGLQVPIKLLAAAPPAGNVTAKPTVNRVDLSGNPGTTSTGSVSFTNSGGSTLTGILVSDAPWLIPQSGVVTIPGNSTGTFNFTIDRSKRTDASSPIGSTFGNISIVFIGGPIATGNKISLAGPTPTVSIVSVVDTVKPAVGTSGAPALGAGEVALFVPGVGHVLGSVGLFISDLSIVNPPGNRPVPDLKFFYLPLGGNTAGQKSATLPTVSIASVAVADVVKNVFGIDGQVGSLQLRAADAAKLAVNATIFNVSNLAGTYGSSIPIFRSDRSVGQGGKVVLSGITQTATSHTNLFIQETTGVGVTVNTEFFDINGTSLGTRSDTVGPFALVQLQRIVPTGAVAAFLSNGSTGGAKFQAYATPVDDASGDTWSVADWATQYGYSQTSPVVVPVAGILRGANNTFFRTDVAFTNSGTSQASGTLRYVSRSGTVVDRTITLGARQSNIISNVIETLFNVNAPSGDVGYLLFTPVAGTMAMTSRTYTTVAGQPATFGTGVPVLSTANLLTPGSLRAIGSIEDSSRKTIVAATPGTFRTNFGLVETSGNAATVRVTVRYQYAAGALTTAVGTASKDYNLNPNQFVQINGLMTDILGSAQRDQLGDLRGIEVDFQVTSTKGAVAVFTSSLDNGSGDSTLRTE